MTTAYAQLGFLVARAPSFRTTLLAPLCVVFLSLSTASVIATIGVQIDIALIIAIILSLASAMLLRLCQRSFDPFEPLFLFVLAWGVMFVARPIAMLLTDNFDFQTYDIRSGFTPMLALGLVGGLGFLGGYSLVGRSLARRFPPLPAKWHADTAVTYSIVIAAIGLALFAIFIIQSGGLSALRSLLQGRQPEQARFFSQSSGYFYQGIFLAVPAGLLTMASGHSRHRPVFVLAGLIILAFVVVRSWSLGTRSWLVPIFGSLFILWYLRRGQRPALHTLLTVIVIGFVFGISFVGSMRVFSTRQAEGTSQLLLQSVTEPQEAWDTFLGGGDTEMASLLALEVQQVPSQIPFQHGAATGEILIHPIPRMLWNDKPRPGDEILARTLFVERGINLAPRQFSPIGNFYLDFGFIGAALGMIVLGAVAHTHYEYFRLNSANPAVQVVYAATLPFWIVLLRGSVTDTAGRLLFVLPPLLLGLYMARSTGEASALVGADTTDSCSS
jgi:hypothetical protein